ARVIPIFASRIGADNHGQYPAHGSPLQGFFRAREERLFAFAVLSTALAFWRATIAKVGPYLGKSPSPRRGAGNCALSTLFPQASRTCERAGFAPRGPDFSHRCPCARNFPKVARGRSTIGCGSFRRGAQRPLNEPMFGGRQLHSRRGHVQSLRGGAA